MYKLHRLNRRLINCSIPEKTTFLLQAAGFTISTEVRNRPGKVVIMGGVGVLAVY